MTLARRIVFIWLVIASQMMFSNACGQIPVQLHLKTSCYGAIRVSGFTVYYKEANKWRHIDYETSRIIVPAVGIYQLYGSFSDGRFDYDVYFGEIKIDGERTDSLSLPKMALNKKGSVDPKDWVYVYCGRVCDGVETEHYENGKIREQGEYVKGKPKWSVVYRPDGTKLNEYWYEVGNILPTRTNRYDSYGQLLEYEVKEFKKRETIIKFFDASGQLIDHNE